MLINKAMIEIPPTFAGKPPVNPEARKNKELFAREWKGAQGLAEDVRYYGQWMRDEAEKHIGHLYPKIEVTSEMAKGRPDLKPYVGKKLTVIAWLWARTVKSPNPAFAKVDVPLASTFMLSTKAGKEAYVEPVPSAEEELRELCAEYVQVLCATLARAGHPLSTRRAVQLARNIIWLRAALIALGVDTPSRSKRGQSPVEDTFYCATRYSLPDIAWGRPIPSARILSAHRASWELLPARADLKAILTETNPLRRIARALESDLEGGRAGQVVADSFASLERPVRLVASAFLVPRLAKRTALPAATLEGIAQTYAALVQSGNETITVSRGGADWKRDVLSTWLPGIDQKTDRGRILTNAAVILMKDNERFKPATLEAAYEKAVAVFGPPRKGRRP